jgi:hypothetical protein
MCRIATAILGTPPADDVTECCLFHNAGCAGDSRLRSVSTRGPQRPAPIPIRIPPALDRPAGRGGPFVAIRQMGRSASGVPSNLSSTGTRWSTMMSMSTTRYAPAAHVGCCRTAPHPGVATAPESHGYRASRHRLAPSDPDRASRVVHAGHPKALEPCRASLRAYLPGPLSILACTSENRRVKALLLHRCPHRPADQRPHELCTRLYPVFPGSRTPPWSGDRIQAPRATGFRMGHRKRDDSGGETQMEPREWFTASVHGTVLCDRENPARIITDGGIPRWGAL